MIGPPRAVPLVVFCLLACVSACASAELAPARVRVRTGPAHGRPARRVVALPATCGSLALPPTDHGSVELEGPGTWKQRERRRPSECERVHLDGVDAAIRAILAFRGHEVIDSEQVNATTLRRTEIERRFRMAGRESATRETDVEGSRFADATPAVQDAILSELRASGVVSARIWIGPPQGMGGRRAVEVQLRLLHVPSGELVWARRCELEVQMESDVAAIERAARCAADGAPP